MMGAVEVLGWLCLIGYAPFGGVAALRIALADDPRQLVREDLETVSERLVAWTDTDDAPLWAEVLGMLVPFGLLFRGASHVLVARLHGIDGQLAEQDVAAGNAVAAIRGGGEPMADLNGRVGSLLVGLTLWWIYLPGAGPTIAIDASHAFAGVVEAYLALNVAVLFADLPLFAVTYRALTTADTDLKHGTN